jgi:signal transduction histidine kinase
MLGVKVAAASARMPARSTVRAECAGSYLLTDEVATAAMAHEIRQPLTAIALQGSATLRWLKATPPNLQEAQACAESVVTSIAWMR